MKGIFNQNNRKAIKNLCLIAKEYFTMHHKYETHQSRNVSLGMYPCQVAVPVLKLSIMP